MNRFDTVSGELAGPPIMQQQALAEGYEQMEIQRGRSANRRQGIAAAAAALFFVCIGSASAQSVVLDVFRTVPQTNGQVEAIAVGYGKVYIGGSFSIVDGVPRSNLAAFNLATGQLDLAWNPDANGTVHALAIQGGGEAVFVGGEFFSVNGEGRHGLVALENADGIKTGEIRPDWAGETDDGAVYALAATQSEVYAGGSFTSVAGTSRNCLAAFQLAGSIEGGGLDANWNPDVQGLSATVKALVASGGWVYAGGEGFNTVNDATHTPNGAQGRNNLAAFMPAGIGTGKGEVRLQWDPGLSSSARVEALATDNGFLYVGGTFSRINANALTRQNLAAIPFSSVHATADSAWNPSIGPSSLSTSVLALAFLAGRLYAGGQFTDVNGADQTHTNLVAVEPAGASRSGAAEADWTWPVTGTFVDALTAGPDGLFVGGDFSQVSDQSAGSLAGFQSASLVVKNAVPTRFWLQYN